MEERAAIRVKCVCLTPQNLTLALPLTRLDVANSGRCLVALRKIRPSQYQGFQGSRTHRRRRQEPSLARQKPSLGPDSILLIHDQQATQFCEAGPRASPIDLVIALTDQLHFSRSWFNDRMLARSPVTRQRLRSRRHPAFFLQRKIGRSLADAVLTRLGMVQSRKYGARREMNQQDAVSCSLDPM